MYTCVGVYCGVLVEVRGQLEEYVLSSFHLVGSGVKLRLLGSAANALPSHHLAGPRRLLAAPGNLATCHCPFVLLPGKSVRSHRFSAWESQFLTLQSRF